MVLSDWLILDLLLLISLSLLCMSSLASSAALLKAIAPAVAPTASGAVMGAAAPKENTVSRPAAIPVSIVPVLFAFRF